jgi:predicted DNA-binding transcriptional regulator YafY
MNHDEVVVGEVVTMTYTNYRGERANRLVLPERVWFGATDWHPAHQWLMDAYDFDRKGLRSFAVCEIEDLQRVDERVSHRHRTSSPAG